VVPWVSAIYRVSEARQRTFSSFPEYPLCVYPKSRNDILWFHGCSLYTVYRRPDGGSPLVSRVSPWLRVYPRSRNDILWFPGYPLYTVYPRLEGGFFLFRGYPLYNCIARPSRDLLWFPDCLLYTVYLRPEGGFPVFPGYPLYSICVSVVEACPVVPWVSTIYRVSKV
jgi:hypothetical protein